MIVETLLVRPPCMVIGLSSVADSCLEEPADFQLVVRLRREGCVRAVFQDIIRLVRSGGVMRTDEINKLADKLRDGQHGRLYMDVRLGTVEIGEQDSQMFA